MERDRGVARAASPRTLTLSAFRCLFAASTPPPLPAHILPAPTAHTASVGHPPAQLGKIVLALGNARRQGMRTGALRVRFGNDARLNSLGADRDLGHHSNGISSPPTRTTARADGSTRRCGTAPGLRGPDGRRASEHAPTGVTEGARSGSNTRRAAGLVRGLRSPRRPLPNGAEDFAITYIAALRAGLPSQRSRMLRFSPVPAPFGILGFSKHLR